MSVLITTSANENIIQATCILYWLDLTVARGLHDYELSQNRFANFGTGFDSFVIVAPVDKGRKSDF